MKQVVLLSLCFFWSFFVYGQDVQKPKPRKSSIANESDVTYDFDARFSENRHDLYIEIVNNEGIMDF